MNDVLKLLVPIRHKWQTIGLSLEVNDTDLECISMCNKPADIKLSMMIRKWLEEKSNEATWKELLQKLEGPIVNNRQIGDDIRTFLKRNDVYSKYVFARHNPMVNKCTIMYLLLMYM